MSSPYCCIVPSPSTSEYKGHWNQWSIHVVSLSETMVVEYIQDFPVLINIWQFDLWNSTGINTMLSLIVTRLNVWGHFLLNSPLKCMHYTVYYFASAAPEWSGVESVSWRVGGPRGYSTFLPKLLFILQHTFFFSFLRASFPPEGFVQISPVYDAVEQPINLFIGLKARRSCENNITG